MIRKDDLYEAMSHVIETHMKSQPWRILCSECGKELEHFAEVDGDMDLYISVTPCNCQRKGDS